MAEKKKTDGVKNIAQNKKAFHDYIVLQKYEAGISLVGTEVKSCRDIGVNLTDSYVMIQGGELKLIGTHIAPYAMGNRFNHEPRRTRVLLMHKREIRKLRRGMEEKGMTLIPLSFYFKHGRVKVEIGLCKGKNVHDKREALKKNMDNREIRRAMAAKR